MATGNRYTDFLARLDKRNDVRRLILNMPSIYQLLPPPLELFPSHTPYEELGILSQLPDLEVLTHLVRERLEQGRTTAEDVRHFHFL